MPSRIRSLARLAILLAAGFLTTLGALLVLRP
jgi:hypothetical protein